MGRHQRTSSQRVGIQFPLAALIFFCHSQQTNRSEPSGQRFKGRFDLVEVNQFGSLARRSTGLHRPVLICPSFLATAILILIVLLPPRLLADRPILILDPVAKNMTMTIGPERVAAFQEMRCTVVDQFGFAGATVVFSSTPFVGHSRSNRAVSKLDSQLSLRVVDSDPHSRWRVVVPADRSQVSSADESAQVVARSQGRGVGVLGLTVTCILPDQIDVEEGQYITTVVGTILEN